MKKTTNIQDEEGGFWNNKWGKLLSQREYKKNNSKNCKYYKFAPCFPTTLIMLGLMSTNLCFSNAWEQGGL